MSLLYIKQLKISGSDIQVGIPTGGSFNTGSLNPSMSIADAINAVSVQGVITIGSPDDGTYADGYFSTWTSNTKISNAFDDVNELLLKIAPSDADALTGLSLTISSPSVFSGYLSAGLDSGSWYSFASPGDQLTTISSDNSSDAVILVSPNQSTAFTGGSSGSFADLVGGVTASISSGSQQTFFSFGQRALSSGIGATNGINITDISTYNSIWLKVNAEMTKSFVNTTGSHRFKLVADNSADESDVTTLYYVGTNTDHFPTQSFVISPYTSSITPSYKYMSGISYYGRNTQFDVNFVAQNLYDPIYSNGDEGLIQSSYFTNATVSTSSLTIPSASWNLTATESITLSNNVTSTYNNLGTFSVRLRKDGKNDVTSANVNIGNRPINTYLTRSTDLIEYFDDEVYRWIAIDSGSWKSTQLLVNGRNQVNNGRLIHPGYGGYSLGSFPANNPQYYYRPFYPTNANENGTITITRSGFGGLSNIVGDWTGSDTLQMAFVIASESGSSIYDLGRVVGDNSGSIYGIRNGAINGNTINWSLPSGKQTTNSDPLVLMVRYINVTASDYITQVTLTFDNG